MVRGRNLTTDIYDQFARLPSREQRNRASQRNPDYQARMEANTRRNIWEERGFSLPELETTSIPTTVEIRGWGQFVRTPGAYHPALVREFYAAMIPEVFHAFDTVIVRGRRVKISVEAINEYFGTAPQPDLQALDGMPDHHFFENTHDPRIAAALRRSGDPTWIPEERDLNFSELSPDMNLWGVFVKHSLLPSRNRTVVVVRDAQVLFAIQQGLDIDVGRVIFWEILNTGRLHGALIFPGLITHFCRVAGIPAASDPDELVDPMSNINRKTYNSFCRVNHLPQMPTDRPPRIRNRNRNQHQPAEQAQEQEQVNEPMEDDAPPSPPQQQMGGQPMTQQEWMNQIMAMTQANAHSVATLSQDFAAFQVSYAADQQEFAAFRQQYTEDQRYNSRRLDAIYDLIGGPHQDLSYHRRPRRNDRDPSTQFPDSSWHPGSSSRYPGDQ